MQQLFVVVLDLVLGFRCANSFKIKRAGQSQEQYGVLLGRRCSLVALAHKLFLILIALNWELSN
jgi:hypothetical protein